MTSKEFSKRFNRLLARQALFLCSLIVKFLPRVWLCGFADFIAVLGYYIAFKQRDIARESLTIAFADSLKQKEITGIIQGCFRNIAKSGMEMLYTMDNPGLSKELVAIEGREYLEEAISKGNGVVAVSAHFGNFPLALTRLQQEGYQVNVILRRMRDDQVEEFLDSRRRKVGINFIHSAPRQACVEESVKALRRNEILFIQLDQNFGTGGVFVNFFGRQAATATGPVVFALRTGAAMVALFIVRQADGRHKLIIEPQIEIEKKDTPDETLRHNIQKITLIIESYIRKYPQEWGWIHRRWKSRPSK